MTSTRRTLLANFASLASIQGVNLLAPLVTLPYLARVIGFEGVGILATAAATCALFGIIIDWGFNLTATRAVSTRRDDLDEIGRIFSSVSIAKLALITLSFLALTGLLLTVETFNRHYQAFLFSFTLVACQALFPVWAFQGLERMASVAVVNALGKTVSVVFVLLLVKKPDQIALVPLIYTLVALVSAAVATFQLQTRHGVRFVRPTITHVRGMLKEGQAIFIATAAGCIHSQGPVLILSALTDLATVGKYSIAQKIAMAAISVFQSLAQAYFPFLSRLWTTTPERFERLVQRYLLATQLASAIVFSTLFVFAAPLYSLLTGVNNNQGIEAMRFWLVIAQMTVLSVMLNPVLVSIGRDRDIARMYIVCSFSFLAYSYVLTSMYLLHGMLVSMVIVELSIAAASLASFRHGVKGRH